VGPHRLFGLEAGYRADVLMCWPYYHVTFTLSGALLGLLTFVPHPPFANSSKVAHAENLHTRVLPWCLNVNCDHGSVDRLVCSGKIQVKTMYVFELNHSPW